MEGSKYKGAITAPLDGEGSMSLGCPVGNPGDSITVSIYCHKLWE